MGVILGLVSGEHGKQGSDYSYSFYGLMTESLQKYVSANTMPALVPLTHKSILMDMIGASYRIKETRVQLKNNYL